MKRKRQVIAVLGGTGAGKSDLIKNKIIPHLEGRVFVLDPLGEYNFGIISDGVGEFKYSLSRPNSTEIYVLRPTAEGDEEFFFRFCYEAGNCWAIIDEVDMYAKPNSIHPDLNKLARYGRHPSVSMIVAARRPSEIHPTLRAQSDCIISFLQREPRDKAALIEKSELFSGVDSLERFCYIIHGTAPGLSE